MNDMKHVPDYMLAQHIRFVQKAVVMHPTENKFLILKRPDTESIRPSTWDIAGGSVKFGELHRDALVREIFEETGLTVNKIKEIQVVTAYHEPKNMYLIIVGSVCKAVHDAVKLSHEHSEFCWVTFEDFFKMYQPNYQFVQQRPFNIHATDFIGDIVHLAHRVITTCTDQST